MPDTPTPPAGLADLEGVVAATTIPLITLPVPFVREMIAWARGLERETPRPRKSAKRIPDQTSAETTKALRILLSRKPTQ